MAMYAVAITPLIHQLEGDGIKQAWYADNTTAGGSLKRLNYSGGTTLFNWVQIMVIFQMLRRPD